MFLNYSANNFIVQKREPLPLGFFLQSNDVSLLSKGHLWSVCMKLNQAAVSQRKVKLVVAEERGTSAAGGALHVFTSNSLFTFKLTGRRRWKEKRRNNKNKCCVRGEQPLSLCAEIQSIFLLLGHVEFIQKRPQMVETKRRDVNGKCIKP